MAEVYGVRLSGLPAWLLWRGYYLSFVPGFATKMRVAAQWLLDLRRRAQHGADRRPPGPPATRYIRYRAGDRVFEEGNRADGFYAVVEGAFELRVRDAEGRETSRHIGPAAISASASCSAKACGPARCARSRIRWCWWSAPKISSV